MDKLTEDFEKSLFDNSKEILGEYIELGIDSFINDGILKDIPIVNSIVAVLKIGKNIHDRNLLRQTLTFINEFNSGNISKDKLNAYKSTIENNPKKCEEELGRILILLNSYVDKEKSVMLAKLYKSYLGQDITWSEFCEYSEIINRIFIQDLEILNDIYHGEIDETTNRTDMYRIERINSLGIIGTSFKSVKISVINGASQNRQDMYISINKNGKKFMDIITK